MHTSPFAPDWLFSAPSFAFVWRKNNQKKANAEISFKLGNQPYLLQTLPHYNPSHLIPGGEFDQIRGIFQGHRPPVLSRQVSIMSSSKSFGFINLPFFSARVKFLPNYRSRTLEAERQKLRLAKTKKIGHHQTRPSKAPNPPTKPTAATALFFYLLLR